jgi:enoyl-CoA hydratase/carnithine racemase
MSNQSRTTPVAKYDSEQRETAASYQHILYEVADKIATITLNRPNRMNAWTPIMERDVRHAMESAAADDDVRVIVLTGAGRAFCAGADMDALKGLDPNDVRRAESTPPFDMNRRPDWQTRYGYYPSIAKPIIGMLNGATAGIGLVHALYCDLRFAADNTVFTTAFSRRGLIAEHGISWMLPRIVGHANALDLLMSARRVQSDEALRIGLVNRLYPPEQLREQTYAYARDLADFVSPSAIAVIKRQLYDAVPDPGRSQHRRQPRDGNRAARQRFPRRRRELYGEAAAEIYGEVREAE